MGPKEALVRMPKTAYPWPAETTPCKILPPGNVAEAQQGTIRKLAEALEVDPAKLAGE
jgi:hypothetical protein